MMNLGILAWLVPMLIMVFVDGVVDMKITTPSMVLYGVQLLVLSGLFIYQFIKSRRRVWSTEHRPSVWHVSDNPEFKDTYSLPFLPPRIKSSSEEADMVVYHTKANKHSPGDEALAAAMATTSIPVGASFVAIPGVYSPKEVEKLLKEEEDGKMPLPFYYSEAIVDSPKEATYRENWVSSATALTLKQNIEKEELAHEDSGS